MTIAIELIDVCKSFVLHHQDKTEIDVLNNISLQVKRGECVVLKGASGAGKSSLLKCLHGNYLSNHGSINFHFNKTSVDMVVATDAQKIDLRENYISYVSQFLRVVPRVSTLNIVAEPLLLSGIDQPRAHQQAGELLTRLNIPEKLWSLSPLTFSGGEQQRVNIAHGFIRKTPFMLLDEPTASLDVNNRNVVIELIHEAKTQGAAIIGIFHDEDVRDQVADRLISFDDGV